MSIGLILGAVVLMGLSGVPGLFFSRRSPGRSGERVAACLMALGAVVGLTGAMTSLGQSPVPELSVPWGLPWGRFSLRVDALSAAFLLPLFVVFGLVPIYGLGYWKHADHPSNARKLRLFFGLMGAVMSLLLIARDGALFLLAWEVMALSAYFLITTEDERPAIREAGFVYLIAAHAGALCLFAFFALWNRATGSLDLVPAAPHLFAPAFATALFLLALIGFGLKAGIMPLHVWLPGAHAGAPSHVSAVLSGVMLKMGIYGLVRITGLLPNPPPWWGGLLVAWGAVSGILGIVFAIGQTDIKRLLAYSSIENMGVIVMGLGLALLGRSSGRADLAALGLAGAILHVWNHSLFKPLLFLGAGSVIHSAGARSTDQLGGLAKTMPRTAGLFLLGAAAICALPPLNGFVSEWLIYLGFFRTLLRGAGPSWAAAATGAPALAMIGALTVVCFVKLFGSIFLGQPRTEQAGSAHEAPLVMIAPMAVLAALCVAIGALPWLAAPALDRALGAWTNDADLHTQPIQAFAALRSIGSVQLGLLLALCVGMVALRARVRRRLAAPVGTWDCGYARPTPRMQYTGTSFSQVLVGVFAWALWPKAGRPRIDTLFPALSTFRTQVPDTVLDRAVFPAFRAMERFLSWFRLLHQGQVQVYILYVLIVVIILFLFV